MMGQSFDILATSLSVLHNYFDGSTKLFSNPYLANTRFHRRRLVILVLRIRKRWTV